MNMDQSRANDATQEASNICSTCGGLDNTIHLCTSNRYVNPESSPLFNECELKRKRRKLTAVLGKLRNARHESYSYVG
jgi:hypothetical protein